MPEPVKNISEIGADSPTTNDLLGFRRFAEPIAERIANATATGTPLTIGVYGEWGSGKTSFLKMIDESLRKQDIHPIWFNAWKYDQEDNLWSALIQTILDQARVNGSWYRRIWTKLKIWRNTLNLRAGSWEIAKGLLSVGLRILFVALGLLIIFGWTSSEISAFLNQVFARWFSTNPVTLTFLQTSVIKAIVAVTAFFVTQPDKWLALFDAKLGIDFSKLKRSKSYRAHIAFLDEFSEEFKRIIKLAGNGKPLVIIIDDLDRCLPKKAIQVLEAIKLFLDVEGCIFLLAVDRDVVEKAIAAKYKDLLAVTKDGQSRPERLFTLLGENYFEKIVQLPFALPPISDRQFKEFVASVYPDEHIRQCSNIFFEGLPRNPRKVKRLLQTFLLLRSFAREGVKNGTMRPSLIAKLVIIQSQFRSVYEDLARFHTLLAELEKLHQSQIAPLTPDDPLAAIDDPILREKAKATTAEFPLLQRVLLQKVDENDTFVGVDIEPYLSLTESTAAVVETKTVGEGSAQDTTAALGQYLSQVASVSQSLSVQSIDASIVPSARPNIESLFIPTPLQSMGPDGRRVETFAFLRMHPRSVILGAPGSGKTTLLSYVATVLARSLMQNDTSLMANRFGISETLLPILIPLREYGRYIQENPSRMSATPAGFLEFLDDYFKRWNIGLPPEFFANYFERGTCILLLDGLDEIMSSERQFAVQAITSLGRRYPTTRIVVTSRPAAYSLGLGEDFAHYVIGGLDDSAITEFVEKWSPVLAGDSKRAESKSASLLAAVFGSDHLRDLASNPLLLTTMVVLNSRRGQLPARRADFYEQALDMLLSRWDATKGVEPTDLSLPEVKSLLGALAFAAQDAALMMLDESFVVSTFKPVLAKKGLSQREAQHLSFSLLTIVEERTGVLVEVGPRTYQFAHLTFQEYLASIALTESRDYVDAVMKRYSQVAWQESIVFSVARVARASRRPAEDAIRALLETQSPEGVLLAGRCLSEIMPLENTELEKRTMRSLASLESK